MFQFSMMTLLVISPFAKRMEQAERPDDPVSLITQLVSKPGSVGKNGPPRHVLETVKRLKRLGVAAFFLCPDAALATCLLFDNAIRHYAMPSALAGRLTP